jgi:formylglycine-generating enzyme required for sulfatase activity
MLCSNGQWIEKGLCRAGWLCESRVGHPVGMCSYALPSCWGLTPGAHACDAGIPITCGPDLITVDYREHCALSTASCIDGECIACPDDTANCDDEPTECETNLSSVNTCGTGCDNLTFCDRSHGEAACVDNQCEVTSCNPPFADCSDEQQGCETFLNASDSCGTSCADRVVCSWPNSRCVDGACVRPPSCEGLASDCGPAGNESCCDSLLVPHTQVTEPRSTGITYEVSEVRLDRFEVTVGRFRKFFSAWQAGWRPTQGQGKHAFLRGGLGLVNTILPYFEWQGPLAEGGWSGVGFPSIEASMTEANFRSCTDLGPGRPGSTWSSNPAGSENRPMVCTTKDEAYAFCIWDGGFLPSAAEWLAAARGGEESRNYPWSQPADSTNIDCDHTDFRCSTPESNRVGAKSPLGDGKYGHADLFGSVQEFVLDTGYPPTCANCSPRICTDCITVSTSGSGATVGFSTPSFGFDQAPWYGQSANARLNSGFRCARAP